MSNSSWKFTVNKDRPLSIKIDNYKQQNFDIYVYIERNSFLCWLTERKLFFSNESYEQHWNVRRSEIILCIMRVATPRLIMVKFDYWFAASILECNKSSHLESSHGVTSLANCLVYRFLFQTFELIFFISSSSAGGGFSVNTIQPFSFWLTLWDGQSYGAGLSYIICICSDFL